MRDLVTSIRKNAIGLGLFAIVTAGSIGIAQVSTKESIEKNIQIAQAKALHEIVPMSTYDNDLLNDTISLTHEGVHQQWNVRLLGPLAEDAVAYVARKDGKAHTVILPVTAPDGYTTNIDMIVGIKLDGSLAGVRVVDHKETPGLGDKVEAKKHPWILQFADLSLLNPEEKMWAVKKDGGQFDQFTGATITPRAVVRSVRLALQFFRLHGKEFTADKKYTRQDSTLDSTPSLTLDSKVLTQTEDLADGE